MTTISGVIEVQKIQLTRTTARLSTANSTTGETEEVALQRLEASRGDHPRDGGGKAEMPLAPGPDRRPVLQQEEQAQSRQGDEDRK